MLHWTDAYVSCLRMGNEERVREKVVEKAENASEKEIARIVRVAASTGEGPVCYYRANQGMFAGLVHAEIHGLPGPTLSWEKDRFFGSFKKIPVFSAFWL